MWRYMNNLRCNRRSSTPQTSQLRRSWMCYLRGKPFIYLYPVAPDKDMQIHCNYIKALQGLMSREMALPPVAPEVIHIQSFYDCFVKPLTELWIWTNFRSRIVKGRFRNRELSPALMQDELTEGNSHPITW